MSTPIRVDDEVKEFLDRNGNTNDSYNSVVKKLINHFKTSGEKL